MTSSSVPSLILLISFLFQTSLSFGVQRLIILHSSEHHGVALPLQIPGAQPVGGLAGRATLIDQVRLEEFPVLVVDSGDILIGTALSSWFRGEPDVKAMNIMGYHAMAAGNHDFDYGISHLKKLQGLATFPILCSNLIGKNRELPCQTSSVVRVGDVSVGLLGILGRSNFPETFNREVVKVLDLKDPADTVRMEAKALKEERKVDLVVVITHQGTEEDRVLLERVSELDVIIGGHTKGFDGLFTPSNDAPVETMKNPDRVFVKTHRQGRTLGRLDLLIESGKIQKAKAQNIPVTAVMKSNQEVQRFLDRYVQKFASQAHKVVGRAHVNLEGEREHIRTQETNLGNLLADLLRLEFGAQIAMLNSGQIRASIPAGPVTLGEVLSVLPFDSSVVTLDLTGAQLLEALENSVSLLPQHSGRFLQVSGLQVTYDLSAHKGHRVHDVKIGDHHLELNQTYSVSTDAFLADGGDGYTMFQNPSRRVDHQIPVRDLLLKTLQNGPLKAGKDGRIRFAHSPHPSS